MTYEPVKLRFRDCGVVGQVDRWSGQGIPPDKETETNVVLDVEVEFRGLKQDFLVHGTIQQKDFDEKKLETKVKAAVIAGMPKRIVIDFFRMAEVAVEPSDPEQDVYEADSQLDDLHAPVLEEQAKAGNAAADEWRAAIEDVIEGLRDGYDYNRQKVRDGMMFHEWCHGAANNGMMTAWCNEKMGYIRSDMQKLGNYKSSSHTNAQKVANNISGLLRSWPIVNSWHQRPPRRPAKQT